MIIVDESDPIDEVEPAFPYRDVTVRRDTTIRDAYEVLDEIGRGKFGRVYRCRDKDTGLTLAAKVVSTKRKDERVNVEREIDIMRRLQHPRLIQLFDAIEDVHRAETCLILEMVGGGELFDRVIQDEFILTERACAVFVRQICEAVEYIHSKSILHLDMKPENVMCLSKNGNRVKIIDFGLARFYDPKKKLQVLFGTPEFVAPEVVNFEEINYATDLWSVGVITYVLLSGLSPFMGETDVETMANVTIAKYDYDDESFDEISNDAKDFISKLLQKDKSKRLSATECLKHPWLQRLPSPPPLPRSSCSDQEDEVEEVLLSESDEELVVESPSEGSSPSNSNGQSPIQFDDDDETCLKSLDSSTPASLANMERTRRLLRGCSPIYSISSTSETESLSPISSPTNFSGVVEKDSDGNDSSCSNGSTTSTQLHSLQNSNNNHNIKRGSLDLTKDHLKIFVSRYSDNPYLFDRPRGLITHLTCTDNKSSSYLRRSSILRHHHTTSTITSSSTTTNNILSQIRRYSYHQLIHQDFEQIIKKPTTTEL